MNTLFKVINIACLVIFLIAATAVMAVGDDSVPAAPNGISLPKGFRYWQLIGVSHREDNQSLRAILGNGTAVNAARKGLTNPWPDGSILGKLVWEDRKHENWGKATVPGQLRHAEFMIKDTFKYAATGGWGFARWKGMELVPFGDDASFAAECFDCHGAARNTDHVFTRPAQIP